MYTAFTVGKGIAINSARLGIITNHFCFETGCFVYYLLRVEFSKLPTSFRAPDLQHACYCQKNVILNDKLNLGAGTINLSVAQNGPSTRITRVPCNSQGTRCTRAL